MTSADKRHWKIILAYNGLLCLSLCVFLTNANWRIGGVARNALFQAFAPIIGTLALSLATIVRMVRARVSVISGIAAILLLAVVSFACLALTIPIMMGV